MAKLSKQTKQHTYDPAPNLIFDGDTVNTQRYDDVYYKHGMGKITGVREAEKSTFELSSNGDLSMTLAFVSEEIVRLRYAYRPVSPAEFSYALDPGARAAGAKVDTSESEDAFTFKTTSLHVSVKREDGRITIKDAASGQVLHEQTKDFYGRSTLLKGLDQMRVTLNTDDDENFYGLGDKAWDTNLRGREFENFNEDSFAYGRERSTLYRTIPFYYGLRDGHAYGLFLDNTFRSFFDFDSYGEDTVNIWTAGGAFDYYFINGPRFSEVARRYTHLTGTPELPPLWALGFHQCRWSYYPEERVREVAQTFRDLKIPCDAIYLDIDYMDGYRCFTWNNEYFPDPKKLIADLRDDGFHTVVMIDPGIKVDENYSVYSGGVAEDVFCRRATGEHMVGPVWPSECVWPDYTNPRVRDWWGPLYRGLYLEDGVSGFWNDMNEPAVFKVNNLTFPDDVRHDMDGHTGSHKEAHNIFGMQMARATYEGLKALQPEKRPFLLARASFSGGQRHAALWTGDNIASWKHLGIANRQCLRLSISGYSMVGSDIGGFVDEPDPELFTRWIQLAVFHPFMRIHSMGNNTDGAAEAEADEVKQAEKENRQDQEPWIHDDEHTDRNREAINLRYRLLPYLYTAFQRHVETGEPVAKNLFFYDQEDPLCREFGDQFLYGNDLLVCPVLRKGAKTMQVYLPKGDWYDFWTAKAVKGGRKMRLKLSADRLPIFVRAGAVIPFGPILQSTAEYPTVDALDLSVFAAPEGSGELFWDAGEGYGYTKDDYTKRSFTVTSDKQRLVLRQESQGQHQSNFKKFNLHIVGLGFEPSQITVDGQSRGDGPALNQKAVSAVIPFDFREVVIEK